MLVRDLMTRDVRTCRDDDTLDLVARQMWEGDCGCVPVVDEDGRPAAMVTDRDVAMAAWTTGLPLSEIPASTAASHAIFVAREDETLDQAEATMRARKVRRLPVVSASGKVTGILSIADIVRHSRLHERHPHEEDGVSANRIAWTLSGITEPWSLAIETPPDVVASAPPTGR